MDFDWKIGDLAEVIDIQDGLDAIGRVGEVVNVFRSGVTLRFETRFSDKLHDGGVDVHDPKKRCWTFMGAKVTPVVFSDDDFSDLL